MLFSEKDGEEGKGSRSQPASESVSQLSARASVSESDFYYVLLCRMYLHFFSIFSFATLASHFDLVEKSAGQYDFLKIRAVCGFFCRIPMLLISMFSKR